jgi:hypothetical protein
VLFYASRVPCSTSHLERRIVAAVTQQLLVAHLHRRANAASFRWLAGTNAHKQSGMRIIFICVPAFFVALPNVTALRWPVVRNKRRPDLIGDVGPVEGALDHPRLLQPQHGDDVVAHLGRGAGL